MNMQALMKQAQAMQKDMMNIKEELDNSTFEGSSSAVKVVVNGNKEIVSIKILDDKDILDDLSILEDMIMLAVNDAMKKVDAETEKKMGKYSNMMPGWM